MKPLNYSLILCWVLFLSWGSAAFLCGADGEKSLLAKYQKKKQKNKEQLLADIQEVLKKAKVLEHKNPEMALEFVRAARDRLIGNQIFSLEEEKVFYKPLAERIEALKELAQEKRVGKMITELSNYKDSVTYWSDHLEAAQRSGVPSYLAGTEEAKKIDPPALIAFRNGTYSYCLLRAWPNQAIDCTVDGSSKIFLPSEVLGVKIASGYYLFHDQLGRFLYVTNPQAFVLTAPTRLSPLLPELPSPTPISVIPKGSSAVKPEMVDEFVKTVFTKGVQTLHMYFDKEKGLTGESGAALRAARDALIEAQLKAYLSKATPDSRSKFKRIITEALNSRPGSPLSDRIQEQLLSEMERSMSNPGRWPQVLLNFVNELVQPNQSP